MRSSMEFHETTEVPWKVEWHEIPWNSRATKWAITKFHRIPWNSMELWCRQMQYHSVPWNSMELWDSYFNQHHVILDFYGIYHGIPRNSRVAKKKSPSSMGFHGIRRAPIQMTQEFHGIPWNIPWNSMELWCRQMTYHLVPWNSMEHWDCHFMAFYPGWTSKGYSMEFHGTLELTNKKSPSSMGFHGIRRAPFQMTQIFHGIGEVYFIVSCMISCHCISDNPLVVEILRYFNSKATFWCPSFWLNGGIPF